MQMDYGAASSISSTRSAQFSADGRIRYISPQNRKRCRVCRESWKTMCFVLLMVLLAGVVSPIRVHSTRFKIEDEKIGGLLNAKVLRNTETGR